MRLFRSFHHGAAIERGECLGHAHAVWLVASLAVRRVNLLAPRLQLIERPAFGWVINLSGSLFFLVADPLRVFLLGHGFDHDRHETVVLAAQFRALSAVYAGVVGLEPGVAHEARYRVLLDAQRRYPPGVNDVVGRSDDAHFLADRHHHGIVHLDEIVLAFWRFTLDLFARSRERTVEGDSLLKVIIAPLPLVAGRFDGDVGLRRVLHRDNGLRRRPRHADQNEKWDHGPDDFDRGVFVKLLGLMPD